MNQTDKYRMATMQKIAGDKAFKKVGAVTYEIGGRRFHIKVKSGQLRKYPFNINAAVLAANYEVYVCGTDDLYYVVPIELIKRMYSDPSAMPDHTHPGLTVVDVCPKYDQIIYGTGGKSLSISKHRNTTLLDEHKLA